ncbi:MAG: DUF11 domain-containing protein, partial [Chloroflexi bacterium]|nr:DUF11 domain-containing protein [Chloroflexota bacterium]
MKKIVLFFIALLIALPANLPTAAPVALAGPLSAPIETVTNTNNTGAGSLRQAIADVDPRGIVLFSPALSGSTIHLSSTLTLNKRLTIDGESHDITISGDSDDDGVGNVRVFRIYSSGVVTITRLTIEKGVANNPSTGGGGILNGGTLTVIDCTFSENSTTYHGGGIANSSSAKTTVIGSSFSRNSSSQRGGGIFNSASGDTVTIINSSFFNNSSFKGGGYYNYNGIITGSLFFGNSASRGGGLYTAGPIVISNSTFISNSAANMGGGIRNDGSHSPLTIHNSTISHNSAGSNGGGIFNNNSARISVYNSTISGNSADTGYGGGIRNESGATLIIVNSTLSDNSASNGGGISNQVFGYLHLTNTIVANSPNGDDCDSQGGVETNTNNLIEDDSCSPDISGDPDLGPLRDNGASLLTHALRPGSLAIDAGDPSACSNAPINNLDQRGIVRPVDGDGDSTAICDVGAFEFRPPNLSITKQAYPDPVQPGAQLTYTIGITNTGDVTLTATITDILPIHVIPTGFLTWTSDIPMPGGVWTTEFSATVEVGYAGPLTNVVQVSTEQGATGIYTETSTAQVTPDLIVTKQASPDPVQAGKALTYTIRVTNTGNMPLSATITDTLPEHVTSTQPLVWPSQVISAPGGV